MASTDTSPSNVSLESALAGIDQEFRPRIISDFSEIRVRFSQAVFTDTAYDAIGLSAGKFCESVLRFLQRELTSQNIPFGTPIPNFTNSCRALGQTPRSAGVESLRILIPRCLDFIYTVRNKRGIGHSGGDIEANKTDIQAIVSNVTWIVCELIRVFYGSSLEESQGLVDSLNARKLPVVWEAFGKKRVLRPDLSAKDRTLVICYTTPNEAVLIEDLFDWVEYSNLSMFKKSVLKPLHRERLVEHNQELDAILLSPLGIQRVEDNILSIKG